MRTVSPSVIAPIELVEGTAAESRFRQERISHWDKVAGWNDGRTGLSGAYHRRLGEIYRHLITPGLRVLEIGCGQGDLLAEVDPSYGVGIDFSPAMIERAAEKHPKLNFFVADAHSPHLDETFDVIILSDLINELWDVRQVLENLAALSTPTTRIIINTYSRLWEQPLAAARRLGLARPLLEQNWMAIEDLSLMADLSGFEIIRHRKEILLPLPLPPLSTIANRYLAKLWPFSTFVLTHVLVVRQRVAPRDRPDPKVSVVVAARNEAGNIESIFERVPELGSSTELIFVEGGSNDGTFQAIEQASSAHPDRPSTALKQTGKGKGDAVRMGFAAASGDILLILDADLTVAPEDLPKFIDVLISGKADFVNGSRLVYPMENHAMRFFNLVGNKFFSMAFTWLLDQFIKDTLCGTKVMWREDYEMLAANRSYFGDFDPFGDFDLLFGAAKLNLKIVDLPIRYRERTYGETNIKRWSSGWLLLKMVLFAARRIKFI